MARWFVDRLPQQGIPSVSLRRLLPQARFVGCPDWEVSGCTADSRRLDPGQVFVAVRGHRHDGHEFVAQALERGAAGVVVERLCPEAGRLQVVVPDTRAAHARLCQALAGDPSENLLTIGVTGACGKAATTLYLRSILEAAGGRFGLVGQHNWSDGVATRPAGAAASTAEGLAAMLAEMVDRGCAGAVLELDHDVLGARRIEGVAFDFAIVTDLGGSPALSHDELIARRTAKSRLFRQLVPGGVAVVNADDIQAELLGAVNLDARRVSFGLNTEADVSARVEHLDRAGSRIWLRGFGREVGVTLRASGASVVSHALAAAAAAWARGVDIGAVVEGLESVASIPGQLEDVQEGQDFDVRIDQARQGVQLHEALTALRSITVGKIHCVVGAEGNRDRSERRSLGFVAEALSDRVILTLDNPRIEDPNQILDDLLAGFVRPGRVRIEPDRQVAIETALADAMPGDAVLIAGKGRQSFQILADRAIPFDDADVARRWLKANRPVTRQSA